MNFTPLKEKTKPEEVSIALLYGTDKKKAEDEVRELVVKPPHALRTIRPKTFAETKRIASLQKNLGN